MKKYEKLAKRRKELGYTLASLGALVGLSKQHMWHLENGDYTLSYKMAYKLSVLLKTTPDELFLEDIKKE